MLTTGRNMDAYQLNDTITGKKTTLRVMQRKGFRRARKIDEDEINLAI